MKKKIYVAIVASAVLAIAAIIISTVIYTTKENNSIEETISGNLDNVEHSAIVTDVEVIPEVVEPEPEPEPEPPFEEYDIHILALGDNLYHKHVASSGLLDDGTRNYDHEYSEILDLLDIADIKIINQETPIAGNDIPFNGYPTFNTPTEVADATAKAGFNVVLAATNHTFDQGINGVIYFYNYYTDNFPNILLCGIHPEGERSMLPKTVIGDESVKIVSDQQELSEDETAVYVDSSLDYSRINLLEIKGITFAVLNYSYGNNTEIFTSAQEHYMDSLCYWDPNTRYYDFNVLNPQVIEDIKLAETIADITIVCPHWGYEYQLSPCDNQVNWGLQMADAGADIIIGAHPHVPQPIEWVETEAGNKAVIYYSLGNYVSTQNQATENLLEEMAWVTVHVAEDGAYVSPEDTGVVPMVNHYSFNPLRYKHTYLLEDYNADLAASHGVLGWGGFSLTMDNLESLTERIMGDYVLTREEIYQQCQVDVE